MYLPRLKLINIGDKITYFNEKGSIDREDILKKNKSENLFHNEDVSFENSPTTGWIIELSSSVPIGNTYREPHFSLSNKELKVHFVISYFKLKDIFPLLKIDNGVIKNELLLLVSSGDFTIDVEGSETYQRNLHLYNMMSNIQDYSISKKELKTGNTVMIRNPYHVEECKYLGSAYMMHFRLSKDNIEISEKNNKCHFFVGNSTIKRKNEKQTKRLIFSVKDTALKDIFLLDNSELNIKYTDILKNFNIDKSYPLIEDFENKTIFSSGEYNYQFLIGDSTNDEVFSNKEVLRDRLLKLNKNYIPENISVVLPNVYAYNEIIEEYI